MYQKLVLQYKCLVVGVSCGDIQIISIIIFTKPDNQTSYLDDTIRKLNHKIFERLNYEYYCNKQAKKRLQMPKKVAAYNPYYQK